MLGCCRRRDRLGFLLETGSLLAAGVAAPQDHLQSDDAIQRPVTRAVNDAHAAAAQHALDLIARDSRPISQVGLARPGLIGDFVGSGPRYVLHRVGLRAKRRFSTCRTVRSAGARHRRRPALPRNVHWST